MAAGVNAVSTPLEMVRDADLLRAMIDPSRTALVVVDVQVDFAAADGAMAGFGADMSAIEPSIDRMATAIDAARAAGMTIVWLRVITREDTDSAASKRLNARRGYPDSALAVCREGTRGADYYRLFPQTGDLEIGKTLYNGFHGTPLDELLRRRGIGALVMIGLTTECCVDCTARDAFHRDYDVFIIADACAGYGEAIHVSALDNLSKNCALLATTQTLVEALGG
ncbi:MAG: hypothetical protein JWR16_3340 [Nevskia sp.]|nr:hypothetical protein [Nevskia sp.]